MVVAVHMAEENAPQGTQDFPYTLRSPRIIPERTGELPPCPFTAIEQNITMTGNLDERG